MESILTVSNITFVVGMLAVLFSVYNYFRNPQLKTEKKEGLLAQKVEWTAELMERRFKDINDSFKELLLQSNNHIHTIDVKVGGLTDAMSCMRTDIVKLSTIIEERIPKR